jgi:antibiotic biosynthesis monooxygenase (ABM) superfamily enzyme
VLGVHMLVPPIGSGDREHGILRTFASTTEREEFYGSPMFAAWEERVAPLVEGEPVYRDLTGLEAWFRATGRGIPPRWKMALATLLGVYPTSLFLNVTIGEALHAWPPYARSFVFAVAMVVLLTWVVMPLVTRLLHRWLHGGREESR